MALKIKPKKFVKGRGDLTQCAVLKLHYSRFCRVLCHLPIASLSYFTHTSCNTVQHIYMRRKMLLSMNWLQQTNLTLVPCNCENRYSVGQKRSRFSVEIYLFSDFHLDLLRIDILFQSGTNFICFSKLKLWAFHM